MCVTVTADGLAKVVEVGGINDVILESMAVTVCVVVEDVWISGMCFFEVASALPTPIMTNVNASKVPMVIINIAAMQLDNERRFSGQTTVGDDDDRYMDSGRIGRSWLSLSLLLPPAA